MKKKAGVIGHFGFGKEFLDGQTVKTKTLAKELKNVLGDEHVTLCDTHNGLKFLIKLPFTGIRMLHSCDNVIILPAHNGIRVIAPLLCFLNIFFHKKLHYVVIGGWLPDMLSGNKTLARSLSRFDGINVEQSHYTKGCTHLDSTMYIQCPTAKNCRPSSNRQPPAIMSRPCP